MGAVYLAHAEGPAGFYKRVALKCILDERRPHQSQALFVNEARLAALLSHPNIVQTFELGEEEGLLYLAMEYVEGLNLRVLQRELLRRRQKVLVPIAIHLCAQALHGLHYAHSFKDASGQSRPILHRDISPENVLLSSGGIVKVADFGIALMTSPGNITPGMTHGKAPYMAPERFDGDVIVDSRCDVFSTGVVLYELLAGEQPFTGSSPLSIADRVLSEQYVDLRRKRPDVPEGLAEIVHRAVRRQPADRFGSALEFAAALESFASMNGLMVTQIEVAALAQSLVEPEVVRAPTFRRTRQLVGAEEVATVQSLNAAYLVDSSDLVASLPTPATTPEPRPTKKKRRVPWIALAVALWGTVGLGVYRWARVEPAMAPAPVVAHAAGATPSTSSTESPGAASAAGVADEVQIELSEPPKVVAGISSRGTKAVTSKSYGTGWVELRVHPWAEAWLDGKRIGVTPLPPLKLAAGKHSLKLVNTELKVDWTVPLSVSAKTQQRILVNLFTLKVTSEAKPREEPAKEPN